MKLKDIIKEQIEYKDVNDIENTFIKTTGDLRRCQLTSLKGSPKVFTGYFDISSNNLESFQYAPSQINGELNASKNNFKSLKYFPNLISKDAAIVGNKSAIDFKDCPFFSCEKFIYTVDNEFTSFENTKNFRYLLLKGDIDSFMFEAFDKQFEFFLEELFERKQAGEDIDLLIEEGAQWCALNDYPAEFWGDE